MNRISSGQTFFIKKVFPVIWFGVLGCFVLITVASGAAVKVPFTLIVPGLMAVFGYGLMKKLVWDLADEVYDCGDSLLIRRNGEEVRIALANIVNISATTMTNPPRATLRLREPGVFGDEITFAPARPFTLNPFARNPIVDDLILRVDAARRA